MNNNINILIEALAVLSNEIISDDGIANNVILEASRKLQELQDENETLKSIIKIYKQKT
jgi:uncharacterized protein (UPF0147 family)